MNGKENANKMTNEEYRKKINELLDKIENISTLKYIYTVISTYLKSRGI